jgi:hypothetical protein
VSASKGSRVYNDIMEKIKSLSYMNGDDEEEEIDHSFEDDLYLVKTPDKVFES